MSTEEIPLERTGNAIRRLIRQYGKFPDDIRKALRPAMREAAQPVLGDARRRSGWSTRIPKALRLAVSFTKRQAGVSVVVDKTKAPHARAHEGIRGNSTFRHPVFQRANRNVWVEQSTRPFLVPAADMHGRRVVEAVNRAVDDAASKAGY